MGKDLQKLAAVTIRSLRDENEKLASVLHTQDAAVKLAFDLYDEGLIIAEDLKDKIQEFIGKTDNELEVIKKASEFNKIANNTSSFRLGNGIADNGTLDPITRMLLEDY